MSEPISWISWIVMSVVWGVGFGILAVQRHSLRRDVENLKEQNEQLKMSLFSPKVSVHIPAVPSTYSRRSWKVPCPQCSAAIRYPETHCEVCANSVSDDDFEKYRAELLRRWTSEDLRS